MAVVVFRRFNLPPVLGYLFVGSVIGPHALNLMDDIHRAESLAEFGVVFLMFSIGLEFSLPKLFSMKRIVFGLGLLQVVVTMALAAGLIMLMGVNWQLGIALGGVFAMSSTAVITKLLAERMRQAVMALALPNAHAGSRQLTVSIGVAASADTPADPSRTSEALLQAADQALYRAKDDGRNRVALA